MTSPIHAHIHSLIASRGPLPFSAFMEVALYHPDLGYYTQDISRQGPKGDYTTAPVLGNLFAHTLARFLAPILRDNPHFSLVEPGPGGGALASQLLLALDCLDALPKSYILVEPLTRPREILDHLLSDLPRNLLARLDICADFPTSFCGLVLANELLDAMPIDLVDSDAASSLSEVLVDSKQQGFVFTHAPIRKELSSIFHDRSIPIYPYYRYSLPVGYTPWLKQVSSCLQTGMIILFDYGYPRHEYYHALRSSSNLVCYSQHQRHDKPLQNPGVDDISAHVDFTCVAESAVNSGLRVGHYCSQAEFLLAFGVAGVFNTLRQQSDNWTGLKLAGELKTLLQPTEMGENVKVMILTTQDQFVPEVLHPSDRAHSL